jgi:uncharacterized membrane protein YidH (DUF202 family)
VTANPPAGYASDPPDGAAERTILAWVRTGLAFGGCTLLVARVLQPRHPLAALVAVLLGVAVAAALVGRAGGRYRARAALLAPVTLLALTAAATALAVVALLAVLTG